LAAAPLPLSFGEKISMTTLPLILNHGHLFIELRGNLWLLDTGGLTASTLSQHVDVKCSGLLGADILNRFDYLIDTAGGRLTISTNELAHDGQNVLLDEFMGIPIVTASVSGSDYRMFFDTGAQISYLQEESLAEFPPAGRVTDFYPGVGQFETDTHEVPITIGGVAFTLRCGSLPGLLGATLMMADTKGIVGNQVLTDRIAGFFPRRSMLCL
jgi:hypothetical protein